MLFVVLVLVQGIIFGKWTKTFASYFPFMSIELLTEIPGEIVLMSIPGYAECRYKSGASDDILSCPNRNLLDILPYLSTLIMYIIIGVVIGLIFRKIKR